MFSDTRYVDATWQLDGGARDHWGGKHFGLTVNIMIWGKVGRNFLAGMGGEQMKTTTS